MSHSGGLNASGCHAGSKPYHCHRSAYEMTKSSSGGNRLKCSAGSTSKDCSKDTSNSPVKKETTYEDKSETAQEITSSFNVMDADGEAITLLGFNYDQTVDVALNKLKSRFNCVDYYVRRNRCTDVPSVVIWSLDAVGNISGIYFRCEAFDGCTYSAEEIFEALTAKYNIIDNNSSDKYSFCGSGIAGERICVDKDTKRLSLQKDKFRQKPLNFD